MRRRILSFLTWTSTLLLLLTSFLTLHSFGRYDLWSWNTSDMLENAASSASLGVGHRHFALNVWIHQDDGDPLCTTLEHISTLTQPTPLPDGQFISSRAGITMAHGARANPTTVSYFGILIPFWPPLILFSLLPGYALISVIRRRPPLKIMSRLFTALSLASFGLAIPLTVMWIRSYDYDHVAVPDKFFSENHGYFLSSRGITYWYFFDEPLHLQRPMWWRFPPSQSSSRLAATMDPASRFLGFGRSKTTWFHQSFFSGRSAPRPLTILAVPYYALLTLALILPTGVLAQRLRILLRSRRRRKGRCPQCGYDLRATPDQCPECGYTPMVPQIHSANPTPPFLPAPPGQ
jgi:hypothetical protein